MNWLLLSLFLLFFAPTIHAQGSSPPTWSVEPSDYQFSANITAVLYVDYELANESSNLVGAFVDDTCRGVASPILVSDMWTYFLTVYSNVTSETIAFKTYVASEDSILDVGETIQFAPDNVWGSPIDPFEWHAILYFDHAPLVEGVPDQTIEESGSFATLDLDDYLTELDGEPVVFSISGNDALTVTVDEENVVTVTPPAADWVGSETVIFTATDVTDNGFSDSDSAVFTVLPFDYPPQVSAIPDQVIGLGGRFPGFDLDDYLTELNGDSIVWSCRFRAADEPVAPPDWTVQPSDYEFSMTVTASVVSEGLKASGGSHELGAFAGEELRGGATPVEALGTWFYFLTVYADTDGEEITFRFYDSVAGEIVPAKEQLIFIANGEHGDPADPFVLHAGNLLIDIDKDNWVRVEVLDESWSGSEDVVFSAMDEGTFHDYSDSSMVTFAVLPDHVPVVEGIPDQTVEEGGTFIMFDLDDYLTELDGEPVVWSVSGNVELTVTVDEENGVTVTPPAADWVGSETLIFTATDVTDNGFSDSDSAVFTVLPFDYPPEVGAIPDQVIGLGGRFPGFDLDDYLTELNGDSIVWSYRFRAADEPVAPPDWTVQPSDYEFSMTVTARVVSEGVEASGGGHQLGAFVSTETPGGAGDELRGVVTPVEAMETWLYFLTVYADTNSEEITFRFYDSVAGKIVPIKEKLTFMADEVTGDPTNPFVLHAGNLLIDIDEDNRVTVEVLDESWSGSEEVVFSAMDEGTLHGYSDSSLVAFAVLPDHVPVVEGIPDQTVEKGNTFTTFDLDDYLTELDGEPVVWSVGGNVELTVTVDEENGVTVTPPAADWVGSETFIFTATDITDNGFSGSDSAAFTVLPFDYPPQVGAIPDQVIGLGGRFPGFDLDDYLTELNGDSIVWSYRFEAADEPVAPPDWTVQPSDYEFSMTMTARVVSEGVEPSGGGHQLGAFAGNELRGVATPVEALVTWLFFLTVYASTNSEEITFRFYDSVAGKIVPIKEKLTFTADEVTGDPTDPFVLHAGNLLIHIDRDNWVSSEVVDESWSGSENVYFAAQDTGTQHEYADSVLVVFTVLSTLAPVVSDIPDQTIQEGKTFETFDLDDYLVRPDADSVIWSDEGSEELTVSIDETSTVTVSTLHEDWFGTETVRFVATHTANSVLQGWDEVIFTVNNVNDVPYLSQELPDVSIVMDDFGSVIIPRLQDYFADVDEGDHLAFIGESLDEGLDSLTIEDSGGTSASDTTAVVVYPAESFVGDIRIMVKATDDSSALVSDTLLLTVKEPNAMPVADAGPDQTAYGGTTVSLDGSGSSDPEGAPLIFHWTAPEEIDLSHTTVENPTFVAPDVVEDSVLLFTLAVNDGELDSNIDTVSVTVVPVSFGDLPDFSAEPPGIGEPVTISVTLPDFFAVDTINLHYMAGGQPGFHEVGMSPEGRSRTFSAEIPGETVTSTGVAYFIHAVDTSANAITSDTVSVPVNFPANTVTSQVSGSPFADGFPKKKWRIVSVPTKLDDPGVSNIFEVGFEVEPGGRSWKLFEWTGSEWVYAAEVTPGGGYWLHQRKKDRAFFTTGSGQSVDLTGTVLSFEPGWNLFSSPYPFPLEVHVDSVTFSGPWTYGDYDGEGWIDNVTLLQPWGGYALYNWTDTLQTLELRPLENLRIRVRERAPSPKGWTLQLAATGNAYSDKANTIGQLADASNKWDRYDQPEPPYIEGYVSLSMDHPEWGRTVTRFTSDIRSQGDKVSIWNIDLHTKGETGSIIFSYQLNGEFPEDQEIWLLDLTSSKPYCLLNNREIVIDTYSKEFPNHYKVVYGPSESISQIIEEVWAQLPQDFSLSQNYPNPFNPETTIRYELKEPGRVKFVIYDLLGREVRTLVNGPQDLGIRSVSWNGRDDHGLVVGTGMYLYRIRIEPLRGNTHFTQTKKMILLK